MKFILKLRRFTKFCYFLLYAIIFIVLVLSIYSLINTWVISKLNNIWILIIIILSVLGLIILFYIFIKLIDYYIAKKEEQLNYLLNKEIKNKLTIHSNNLFYKDVDQLKKDKILNDVTYSYPDFEKIFLSDSIKPIFVLSSHGSGRTTFLKEIISKNDEKFQFIVIDVRKWNYSSNSLSNSSRFLSYFSEIPNKFQQNKKSIILSSLNALRIAVDIILTTVVKSKSSDFKTDKNPFPFDDSTINVESINQVIKSFNKSAKNKICFLIDHLDDLDENALVEILKLIYYFFNHPDSKFKFIISYDPKQLLYITKKSSFPYLPFLSFFSLQIKKEADWFIFCKEYFELYTNDKFQDDKFIETLKKHLKPKNFELNYLVLTSFLDDYIFNFQEKQITLKEYLNSQEI